MDENQSKIIQEKLIKNQMEINQNHMEVKNLLKLVENWLI